MINSKLKINKMFGVVLELFKRAIYWRWKLIVGILIFVFFITNYKWFSKKNPHVKRLPLIRYLKPKNYPYENDTLEWTSTFDKVSQSEQYCNNFEKNVKGEEGLLPPKMKLVSVHVIIRHGDRSSIHKPRSGVPINLNCQVNVTQYPKHRKLHSFIDHLKRMSKLRHPYDPFRHVDTYPSRKLCEYGDLTPLGLLQHLELGKFLGAVYNRELKLLSRNYPRENVHIRSTKLSRTYQSALAFLYGFLPKFQLKDLNIVEQQHRSFCSSKHFHQPCNCPVTRKLQKLVNTQLKLQNKSSPDVLIKELRKSFDIFVREKEVFGYIDTLMARYCHGLPLPLPCIVFGKCNTTDFLNIMWKLSNNYVKRQLRTISYHKLHMLATHPLLYEIAHRMKMNSRLPDHRQVKFVLLSGHDITLSPLLVALGIHRGKWPPYASRLVFEQYVDNSSRGTIHHVRVLFNGVNVTNKVRFCKNSDASDACPLSNFMKFIGTELFEKHFDVDSYKSACKF